MTSPQPAPIRVLIADDQKVVRDGLAMLLGLLDGIDVVGTAVDGADAVRQALDREPDIVLMDLNMPTVDGAEATRRLVEQGARARVVVLTTYADDDWVFRALQAGARGFLTKDAGAAEIEHAITTVAADQAQLDPSVQRRLLEALAAGAPLGVPRAVAVVHRLTAVDRLPRIGAVDREHRLVRLGRQHRVRRLGPQWDSGEYSDCISHHLFHVEVGSFQPLCEAVRILVAG